MNRKKTLLVLAITIVFLLKLWINSYLLGENGDTYNFFNIALSIKTGSSLLEEKRMPLFPLLLSISQSDSFIIYGHLLVNLFYFLSIILFFYTLKYYVKEFKWLVLGTLIFATNMIIVDNSFYIMSDALFTLLFLMFLYVYNRSARNINRNSILLLSLIAFGAFYTRPEGGLLILILGVITIISKNYKQLLFFCLLGAALALPIIIKSITLAQLGLSVGYLSDKAGLNITFKNIYMGISLILFGIGGSWVIPQIYLIKNRHKKITAELLSLEFLAFACFSGVLVLWGPYIRLYSVPIVLLIIFFTREWEHAGEISVSKFKYIVVTAINLILFTIAVQIFNQRDLGMFKLSKAVTISLSFAVSLFIFWYYRKRRFIYAILFVSSIIIINLTVFVERFVATRYKYYTIVEASKYYKDRFQKEETIAYSDESGVEKWYLRDYRTVVYPPNIRSGFIENWLSNNDVHYFILTEEMGDNSENEKALKVFLKNYPVVREFHSKGYGGYSKIVSTSD